MASASATPAAPTLDGVHPDIPPAAALSIEGILVRHRPPGRTVGLSPVATGAGLHYAAMRLEQTGRPVPHALLPATRGEPSTVVEVVDRRP